MENELSGIISEQNLKDKETRELVSQAFATGGIPEDGTAIPKVMKPMSLFAKGNPYAEKRSIVLDLLVGFYEKYKSLTNRYPMRLEDE